MNLQKTRTAVRGFYRKASDRLVYWDYSAAVDLCGLGYSADVMDIVEWGVGGSSCNLGCFGRDCRFADSAREVGWLECRNGF